MCSVTKVSILDLVSNCKEEGFHVQPAEIEAVQHATQYILPENVKKSLFSQLHDIQRTDHESIGEKVNEETVLGYFCKKSKNIKPSTL